MCVIRAESFRLSFKAIKMVLLEYKKYFLIIYGKDGERKWEIETVVEVSYV